MQIFFKIYGTLIIAIVALIQPWVRTLWKKCFQQGKIEIYRTGDIEIGYSAFGTTIGLNGTLRCINRDLFVQSIKLKLTKQKDSSKHDFEWGAFRSEQLSTKGREVSATLPRGFILSTISPFPYSIQFHDAELKSDIIKKLIKLKNEWSKVIYDVGRPEMLRILSQHTPFPPELDALYKNFSKSEIHVSSFTSLDRMCYWEASKYTMKLTISTSKPDKFFNKIYKFTLTEQDIQLIRLNIVKLLQDVCGHPSIGDYFFAYPKYEEVKPRTNQETKKTSRRIS